MKDEFRNYLETVGINTPTTLETIEQILHDASKICQDEIEAMLVDEYTQQDGKRIYNDLHLFSKKYSFTANQFLSKQEYYLLPLRGNITHLVIQKKDYDFEEPTEASRISVTFQFKHSEIQGVLTASKENCAHLWSIIKTHLQPNMVL